MPWKGEKVPYKIWLSEIILQQTRVEQGRAYYERFIRAFPTVQQLAKAKDDAVFKLWEGLGYYSRCRNLLETARFIADHRKGIFPTDYTGLLALKGVGPYTAAAIASFAYNLPHAVVDGNVQRVLARYFGIATPIDSKAGRKKIEALAQELLPERNAGVYNQAIMDFGAVVCKPKQPLCSRCVQRNQCKAMLSGRVAALPVKSKAIKRKERWFTYYVFMHGNTFAVRKRRHSDIWQHLYEFILHEEQHPFSTPDAVQVPPAWLRKPSTKQWPTTVHFHQELSHQRVHARFVPCSVRPADLLLGDVEWITRKELAHRPFPVIINQFLQQETV